MRIGRGAFQGCSSLPAIHIPESVVRIGAFAFAHCTALCGEDDGIMALPPSLVELGYGAFGGCSSISGFYISAKNETYRVVNDALMTKSGTLVSYPSGRQTRAFDIPPETTEIGQYAFVDSGRLNAVSIPSGVRAIGEYAFWGRSGIRSIEVPPSVESIGENAFRGKITLLVKKGSYAESWAQENLHSHESA